MNYKKFKGGLNLFNLVLIILIIWIICLYKYKNSIYYQQTKNSIFKVYTNKGLYGEYRLFKKLKKLRGYKRFLINCYIPKNNNETTEIDIIMIHYSGIYVFESKNYSGWIYGQENDYYWTQVIARKGNIYKNKFFNPIRQNAYHIKWLKKLINVNLPIYSIIVFGQKTTLKKIKITSHQHYITKSSYVLSKIKQQHLHTNHLLDRNSIDNLYYTLLPYTKTKKKIKIKHIRNINNKH